MKSHRRFSGKLWKSITNEVMESAENLSDRKWKKILAEAAEYLGVHKGISTLEQAVSKLGIKSGRAVGFEPDSDSE
jgi:hypothetical protein